ncbi:MAG: hypothetical protein RR371_01650 [Bacteroides sp.]
MKNFLLSSFLFLLTATQVGAQSVNVTVQSKDGDKHEESIELPESMSYEIDSLLSDWNSRSYIIGNGDCQTGSIKFNCSIQLIHILLIKNIDIYHDS